MDRQRDVFSHWQYLTMGDHRVRPEHTALDGIVLPHDDPFWQEHFPPWDFGCRCQVVPLLPEDVEEIEQRDQALEPDKRLVLDQVGRDQLNQAGRLVRGPNQIFDVRSPREKGNPYRFQPGEMGMDIESLKGRYDEETWNVFAAWARKTKIGAGKMTVWQWLEKQS
jgi:hypothetical protein